MSIIERKLKDQALSILKEQGGKLKEYLNESFIFHITQKDLDEADKIDGFTEITSVGYDLEEIKAYQREKWERIVIESGLANLKKTSTYQLLVLAEPETEEKLTLDTFLGMGKSDETYVSPEYHKMMVYSTAVNLCLEQKNITFNNAIKRVLQKEKKALRHIFKKMGMKKCYQRS